MDTGILNILTRLGISSAIVLHSMFSFGQIGQKEWGKRFGEIEFDSTLYIQDPDIEYDHEYFIGFSTENLYLGYQKGTSLTVTCYLDNGLDSEIKYNYDYLKDTCMITREESYLMFQHIGVRIFFHDQDYYLNNEHLVLALFMSKFNDVMSYCIKNGIYKIDEKEK